MDAQALLDAATVRRLSLPGRGVEIAVRDWGGDGPVALLHHANGFCKGVWLLVADALRAEFRVVAMDARGHGDSSRPEGPDAYSWEAIADDAAAVSDLLAAEAPDRRVALGIGNSFGGTALVGAAARRPGRFGRLVLVDPVVPPPGVAHVATGGFTQRLVDGARRRRAEWPSRDAARAYCRERALFADWVDAALEAYVLDGMTTAPDGTVRLKCPGAVEGAIFAGSHEVDLFARARAVDCPALVLWAARGYFPREVHEAFAAAFRHGRFEVMDAGHLAPMEHPDVVVAHVRDALRA